ncbi:hypothetical protein [Leptospira bandrabouensis]|uniref:Uncharacterized protein n=1 Tax=Leptospira bandrabouensis TaxID=2484903 RepID=A0A6H3NT69_9LEPT|nr:hypothetical protein [Leptospira bandrabouensis]TGN07455.1 hypothetical protein EHR07_04855 [Leptospira bandrabouensis]TGN12800.1 hypothetical protein EHR08_15750 [Leptospira bandrabouensis]
MNVDLSEQELYHITLGLRTVYEYQKKIIENAERNKQWNLFIKIDKLKSNNNEVKKTLEKFHLLTLPKKEGEINVAE